MAFGFEEGRLSPKLDCCLEIREETSSHQDFQLIIKWVHFERLGERI